MGGPRKPYRRIYTVGGPIWGVSDPPKLGFGGVETPKNRVFGGSKVPKNRKKCPKQAKTGPKIGKMGQKIEKMGRFCHFRVPNTPKKCFFGGLTPPKPGFGGPGGLFLGF